MIRKDFHDGNDTNMVWFHRARYRVVVLISDFMYMLIYNNTVVAFARPELSRLLPILDHSRHLKLPIRPRFASRHKGKVRLTLYGFLDGHFSRLEGPSCRRSERDMESANLKTCS